MRELLCRKCASDYQRYDSSVDIERKKVAPAPNLECHWCERNIYSMCFMVVGTKKPRRMHGGSNEKTPVTLEWSADEEI